MFCGLFLATQIFFLFHFECCSLHTFFRTKKSRSRRCEGTDRFLHADCYPQNWFLAQEETSLFSDPLRTAENDWLLMVSLRCNICGFLLSVKDTRGMPIHYASQITLPVMQLVWRVWRFEEYTSRRGWGLRQQQQHQHQHQHQQQQQQRRRQVRLQKTACFYRAAKTRTAKNTDSVWNRLGYSPVRPSYNSTYCMCCGARFLACKHNHKYR